MHSYVVRMGQLEIKMRLIRENGVVMHQRKTRRNMRLYQL